MIKFLEKLLNLIYLKKCFYCKTSKENSLLCSKCRRKINFMPPAVLKNLYDCNVYSCSIYEDIIKQLIKDLKYHKKKNLAEIQANVMYEYFKRLNLNDNFLILSVPIHEKRRKERKYNHMDLVCDEFSKLSGLENNKKFLLRIKDTEKQYKLSKQQRIQNLKNAFKLNETENIDKNTNLLILDDITSTGATLEEIIKLLKNNGYNKITALTLATPDIWNETKK